jgi:predicted CopG family antitoxin
MIAVSEDNYMALKRLGNAGDSFNDVVTEVLKRITKNNEQEVAV